MVRERFASVGLCLSLVAVTLGPATSLPATAEAGFVERSGSGLTLDGSAFRFTGINIYNANSDGNCGATVDLDQALADIGPGKAVIRAWFFQNMATTSGARDWTRMDETIAKAAAHGVRLIPVLSNQWADCDQGYGFKAKTWYETGYKTQDPEGTVSYRDWVAEIVDRYKDSPTVAFWQLINEAEVQDVAFGDCSAVTDPAQTLGTWAQDVAGLVKSIDANHLVSLGTIGGGQCGTQGSDYEYVHSLTELDLCEYHDYGSPFDPLPGDEFNGFEVRVEQCINNLGKPLFVGEAGIIPEDVGGLEARAVLMAAKLAAQFKAGSSGFLAWAYFDPPSPNTFDIGPGDPVLSALSLQKAPNSGVINVGIAMASGPEVAFHPLVAIRDGHFAFAASEEAESSDFNADGDQQDAVLHVFDPSTLTATNIGISVAGLMVPTADGVGFLASESAQDVDFNGDADKVDNVPHIYIPSSNRLLNSGIAAKTEFASPVGVAMGGGELAFLADESAQGVDLNGDGDQHDAVMGVFDPAGPTLNNLGLAATHPGFPGANGSLAFAVTEQSQSVDLNGDGDMSDWVPHIFDPANSGIVNIARAGTGGLWLSDGRFAFNAVESWENNDFNGDGDMADGVPNVFDPVSTSVVNLGIAGTVATAIDLGGMVFSGSEIGEGVDLNGDGDIDFEGVPHLYHGDSGVIVNVGIAGSTGPFIEDRVLIFASEPLEGRDLTGDGDLDEQAVLHVLDPTTAGLRNTGFDTGGRPLVVLRGGDMAFLASEQTQDADLNGDGDKLDTVPQVLDPPTGNIINIGVAGHFGAGIDPVEGGLDDERLAFLASEAEEGLDLNGDGDTTDLAVPTVYDPATGRVTNVGIAASFVPFVALSGGGFAFPALETGQLTDFNNDGDEDDVVAQVWLGAGDFDVTPPELTLPGDIDVEAMGPDGAIVEYEVSVTDDTDPLPRFSCDPESGALQPLGENTVNCVAADDAGNFTSGEFRVTVFVGKATFAGFIEDIRELGLSPGIQRNLTALVASAQRAFVSGKIPNAIQLLNVLIREVNALERGGRLPASESQMLRSSALAIIEALG